MKHQKKVTLLLKTARFKVNPKTGCWEWSMVGREGYGQIVQNNKVFDMHRLSYVMFVGEIQFGQCVLHKCDNRACFNPDHLFIGSRADNAKDRDKKGRVSRGETHYKTTLSAWQIEEIRRMYRNGIRPMYIQKKFKLSSSALAAITQRKTWKYLTK